VLLELSTDEELVDSDETLEADEILLRLLLLELSMDDELDVLLLLELSIDDELVLRLDVELELNSSTFVTNTHLFTSSSYIMEYRLSE
jgi:hypothetical protein